MNADTNAPLTNVLGKNKWFHDKREHNFQINHLNVMFKQKDCTSKKICHLIIFVVKN